MLSHFSRVWLFAVPWTVAHQAPLSMGFSRQEYWSALPFPFPGNLSNPGIEPTFLMSPALAGEFFTTNTTWGALQWMWGISKLELLADSCLPETSWHYGYLNQTAVCLWRIWCRAGNSIFTVYFSPLQAIWPWNYYFLFYKRGSLSSEKLFTQVKIWTQV